MTDDIVARLRNCDCIPHCLCGEAADEIERLRNGGCARDQRTTQFCAEAEVLQREIERLRSERDEAIIHANNVVRESSSLITAKIPCGSCGGYWNAVDNFRRFESKTT